MARQKSSRDSSEAGNLARSLREMEKRGCVADTVTCTQRRGRRFWSHDYLTFGDIIALCEGGVWLIQTTSKSNISARRNKILACADAKRVLELGVRIVIHGWERSKAKGVLQSYDLTEREVTLADF